MIVAAFEGSGKPAKTRSPRGTFEQARSEANPLSYRASALWSRPFQGQFGPEGSRLNPRWI